jgi:hypothetical protein
MIQKGFPQHAESQFAPSFQTAPNPAPIFVNMNSEERILSKIKINREYFTLRAGVLRLILIVR